MRQDSRCRYSLPQLAYAAPLAVLVLSMPLASTASWAQATGPRNQKLEPVPLDQRPTGPGGRAAAPGAAPVPSPFNDARGFVEAGQRTLAIDGRIVGGQPAPIGAYPWQVSIGLANRPASLGHFCGGTIINAKWIVTAAHCMDGVSGPDAIQVKYGSNFLSRDGTTVTVEEIKIHPNWNRPTFTNDVALIRLKDSLPSAVPLRLLQPQEAEQLAGEGILAVVSGWGLTQENGAPADVLQQVGVQIVSNQICNAPQSYGGRVTNEMFCAGFVQGGRDSCQGDSGGPLMAFDRRGGYVLAGIVSWGDGCARANKFGIYTRVSLFTQWIADTAKP